MRVLLVIALIFVSYGNAAQQVNSGGRIERAQSPEVPSTNGAEKHFRVQRPPLGGIPFTTFMGVKNELSEDLLLLHDDCVYSFSPPFEIIAAGNYTTFDPKPKAPAVCCATQFVTPDRKSWLAVYVIMNPSIDMDVTVRSNWNINVVHESNPQVDIPSPFTHAEVFTVYDQAHVSNSWLGNAEHKTSSTSSRRGRRHRRPKQAANVIIKG